MSITGKMRPNVLFLAAISFLVTASLFLSGALSPFDLKAYDILSRTLNPKKAADDIVIVKIDQKSIDALGGENITWPWPRQMYVPLLEYLSQADAVFIDILFTEPSSYGDEDDLLLSDAVRKADNVYLPAFLMTEKPGDSAVGRVFVDKIALPGNPPPGRTFLSILPPILPLQKAVRGGGNVVIHPDKDGVYRGVPLMFGLHDRLISNFALAYLIRTGMATVHEGSVSVAGAPVPLAGDTLLLRYSLKPFPQVSASALLKAYSRGDSSGTGEMSRDYFKGKKVFIGLTAAGLYDLKPSAVSNLSTGVEIHAATLDALLHKKYLIPVPAAWTLLFMLLMCGAASWFILTHHSLWANLGFFCGAAIAAAGVPALLFAQSYYLPIIPPTTALLIACIFSAGYSYATEGKERRFVRRAWAQYMDETLVRHLLENPDLIKPGGQRQRVTVFFADIAGFTTLAEKLPAEDTAKILHTVLNAFSEVIIAHHGVIDKYIGDCIMAFWGAPVRTGREEIDACHAALQCQETLATINRRFLAEGITPISIRIGIHSGDAIVGNLGSDRLFDYTVIGDTVNLASRLESANKQFNTRILISGDTLSCAGEGLPVREVGLIQVKGKQAPVRIYELFPPVGQSSDEIASLLDCHRQAMELFRKKRWQEASDLFAKVAAVNPGDGPAAYYNAWCEKLLAAPPTKDGWDTIKMTEK